MSRLDRHIALVQSKLTLRGFLAAVACTTLGLWGVIWLGLVVARVFQVFPPRPQAFVWAGLALAIAAALVWSVLRKPTALQAAIAIDDRLGLKEKFSTALIYRQSSDPFAAAAVKDALSTAENVSLHKRFPMEYPPMALWSITAGLALLLTVWLLPNFDLFGKEAKHRQFVAEQQKRDDAKHTVEKALATVSAYPKSLQSAEAVELAKKDLENLLNQPIKDAAATNRTAFKALEQANDAVKEEIKKSDQFAVAQSDRKMLGSLNPQPSEQGPVADAQRSIAKGDFSQAMDQLNSMTQKFDQMSDAEKQKAAAQMANLAKQLQQMAQNPAQQQQLQQQLQQMGASKDQAKQLQQLMQQAAAGDPQAQQQLQQMQQQMQQQMNNGKGPTPQQQAAMQQMMKAMQAQANSQQTAQQMAQSAQQMAQAMKQSASQQGSQQQGGQMAQAQQQMQQALGQMDAVQKDAEQMAAAQDSTAQAQADAAGQGNGQGKDGNNGNGDKSGSDKTGEWKAGDPNNQNGQGMGGPGHGNGGNAVKGEAPYTIKKELAPTQDIDNGRILASTFVKAGTIKGESKVGLSQAAEAAMKDAPDEVDEEAVSKESQNVVKKYFETLQQD